MADSILGQILVATQDALRDDVILDGVEREHIIIQPVPNDTSAPKARPYISVSSYLAESFPEPSTTDTDDYGYPISIFIVDKKSEVLKDFNSLDRRLVWREAIIDHFIRLRIDIAATATKWKTTIIEGSPIADISAWFDNELWVSPITVRVVQRVTRRT